MMDNSAEILRLLPEEKPLLRTAARCWKIPDVFSRGQVPGQVVFTDQRILFCSNGLIEALRIAFALPYADLASVQPCTVGIFMPTGILLERKDGKEYRLSMSDRKRFLSFLEARISGGSGV